MQVKSPARGVSSARRVTGRSNELRHASRSTLMNGWTSTVQQPATAVAFTREEIIDHDREWAYVLKEVYQALVEHRRLTRRGLSTTEVRARLLTLGQMVKNMEKVWEKHGKWNRYYEVSDGALHMHTGCRVFSEHTIHYVRVDLSGVDANVVAESHVMCKHCCCKPVNVSQKTIDKAYRKYMLIP